MTLESSSKPVVQGKEALLGRDGLCGSNEAIILEWSSGSTRSVLDLQTHLDCVDGDGGNFGYASGRSSRGYVLQEELSGRFSFLALNLHVVVLSVLFYLNISIVI